MNEQVRVLLAEPQRNLRAPLQEVLEQEGYEVQPASHMEEVVRKMHGAEAPDVCILDVAYVKDNLDMLRRLRQSEETFAIPILVLAHSGEEQEAMRAQKAGATHFLVKEQMHSTGIAEIAKSLLQKHGQRA